MSAWQIKRENDALNRAKALSEVGDQRGSYETLVPLVHRRQQRQWTVTMEAIVMRLAEICVELRRPMKEVFYQFRMLATTQSLSKTLLYWVELSEKAAQKELAEAYAAFEERAVTLKESGASDEQIESERTQVQFGTQYLRYQWDAYRTLLDTIRNNGELTDVYHDVVGRSIKFCTTLKRTGEFRKLCYNLRQHLEFIQKKQGQPAQTMTIGGRSVTLVGVDINKAEVLQPFLQGRFDVLEAATQLQMWQQAYYQIEEIHSLIDASDAELPQRFVSTYYRQLASVFSQSNRPSFHAYSLEACLSLAEQTLAEQASVKLEELLTAKTSFEQAKEQVELMMRDERDKMRPLVDKLILASLACPVEDLGSVTSQDQKRISLSWKERRTAKLAQVLGFSETPIRAVIVARIAASDDTKTGVLARATPVVAQLFRELQQCATPLRLAKRVLPLIEQATQPEALRMYASRLREVLTVLVLDRISRLYKSVSFQRLQLVLPHCTSVEIERTLAREAQRQHMLVQIDHLQGVVHFEVESHMESALLSQALSDASAHLRRAVAVTQQSTGELAQTRADDAEYVFERVRANVDGDNERVFDKLTALAEQQKEAALEAKRRELEKQKRQAEEKARREEETRRRLAQDKVKREREQAAKKMRDAMLKVMEQKVDMLKEQLEELRKTPGEEWTYAHRELEALLARPLDQLTDAELTDARAQLTTARQEADDRRQQQEERRLDYMVRALRQVEAPQLRAQWQKERKNDMATLKQEFLEFRKQHRMEWLQTQKTKKRLGRMEDSAQEMLAKVLEKRQEALDFELRDWEQKKAKFDEKQRQLEEERRRAEELRAAKEAHTASVSSKKSTRGGKSSLNRQADVASDFMARRKALAAQRKAAADGGATATAPATTSTPPAAASAESSPAPRRYVPPSSGSRYVPPSARGAAMSDRSADSERSGSGSSRPMRSGWGSRYADREREQERPAPRRWGGPMRPARDDGPSRPSSGAAPRRSGGYVPPHLRNK